jgi:hypothetical protein
MFNPQKLMAEREKIKIFSCNTKIHERKLPSCAGPAAGPFFYFQRFNRHRHLRELSHITPSSFQLFKITNQDGNEINSGRN